MSDPLDDPSYDREPVGGGAESVPDPATPENPFETEQDLADDPDAVANDDLQQGGTER
ncbi:MAG TPA: hypothetical protein VN200_03680 [Rhodoglobus sp.]|nr:hypothetical protein [Rhodoglobus sp.]